MKTAVSLPDDVFKRADRLAKRLRMSRSELYRKALAEYVARHEADSVTEAMNNAVDAVDGEDEVGFRRAAARRVLERSEW